MNQDDRKVNHKRVFEFREKKDLRFQPNNRRKPDCGLAVETVFAIDQNTKDHVWSYDFTHERTKDNRSFRILTVIDEFAGKSLSTVVRRASISIASNTVAHFAGSRASL
tara:strand:- start:45 stop:371 length:327 start_codon:yes stop_codon:yes gene_type:complete